MNALIRKIKIKKIIKGIIIISCTMVIALLVDMCVWEICYGPWPYCNKKAELTYLGTAAGECPYFKDENGKLDPEQWKEKKYVYCCCQSYICIGGGMETFSEECRINYNFDFTFREGHRYVCAYGYPLKILRYTEKYTTYNGKYYNRAKLDKKNYHEGIWYIYEIDDINIGDMSEEWDLKDIKNSY